MMRHPTVPVTVPCVPSCRTPCSLLLLALLFCAACGEVGAALGVSADTKRGLVGNMIIFDDFVGGTCGINNVTVTVTGGSYSSSDVTETVPGGELTGITTGYWNVSNVPTGSTVTITTTDSYGQLQDANHTVLVTSVSESVAPPQVVAPIRLRPLPGVECFCEGGQGGCEG